MRKRLSTGQVSREKMSKLKQWESEEELAQVIVAWLTDLKWTVYQEVQVGLYGSTADIVAVNESRLAWIVETKRSFGFRVLDQARRWQYMAHYVSVAVPMRRGGLTQLERDTLKWLGVGCLYVYSHGNIREEVAPRLNRTLIHRTTDIRSYLTEKHKTFALAGNATGKRLTPFQNTCDEIRLEAQRNPGITLKELLLRINTHYCSTATAKSCLARWGSQGIIKGTRFVKEGKVWRIYPN